MYTIFINNKPVIFSQKILSDGYSNFEAENFTEIIIEDLINGSLMSLNKTGVIIYCEDENYAWKKFSDNFKLIEAAGGLVWNDKDQLLLIYRNGKWDLPKGKIEKGESTEEASLREVCEETGVCDLEIDKKLSETYHTYTTSKKNILKKTYWFVMHCKSFTGFNVQAEEGIENAVWMTKAEVEEAMQNTYASVSDLLKKVYA